MPCQCLTPLHSAINSAVKTQQLLSRIYLEVPNFTLVPLLHAGFGVIWTRWGGLWAADHLHSAPCRAGLWLPKYYTATTELRKKVKMWKIKTLPGLCSSTATAIERLVFSHSKSTNPVAGKALQERTLSLLGWILDDDISKSKMSAIKPLTLLLLLFLLYAL